MDETIRRTIGHSEALRLELRLFPVREHPRELARGEMLVILEGEPLWCRESEDGKDVPVAWTRVDLLEFLGRKWPWLTLEENYPVFVSPLHSGKPLCQPGGGRPASARFPGLFQPFARGAKRPLAEGRGVSRGSRQGKAPRLERD